jgi:CubicO group peptidase (beta-lactamase class C family)
MRKSLIWSGGALGLVLVGLVAAGLYWRVPDIAAVFTGGSAKMLCSDVFVGGRDPALAYEQDFRRKSVPGRYLGIVRPTVDDEAKTVTASLYGLQKRTAIFREGIGCTAAEGASVADLRAQGEGPAWRLPPPDPQALWPQGEATLAGSPAGVDPAKLTAALDRAFAETDPEKPRGTRGVVVVHAGRIIAERYAGGYGKDTAHLSNSVAKSVTSALIGILVGRGKLDVKAPAPIAEWRRPGDPRGAITLEHLLHMSSGLQFEESYTKLTSDITMQYIGGDQAGFAAAKPLEAAPGTKFHYSTGTAHILGRIVRQAAGPDLPTAFAFPRRALFEPLGMRTAVLEVDTKGNFVGGSSFFASPRDYARLGLLYLHDGVWEGQRILPEGWVAYTRTPAPHAEPEHPYGVQFWLNWDGRSDQRRYPKLPDDAYFMNGHQGQHVVIIPSRDLVVVRVGLTEFDNWKLSELVEDVLAALPAPPAPLKVAAL